MKRLKSKLLTITETPYDLVDYEGRDIQIAYEPMIMNLCDKDVRVKFEDSEDADFITLSPGEAFSTNFPVTHMIVLDKSIVKYSYWVD